MKFCRVKNLFSLFGKAFFSFLNLCCWDTRYSILLKKKKKKKKKAIYSRAETKMSKDSKFG